MRQSLDQTSVPHAESSRTLWRQARPRSLAAAELPSIEPGISRTALAARFTHLVGHAPMQYPALWRMQMTARLLADRSMKVAAVGHEVGYESEAAFSRAFKELVGMLPAGWRDTAVGIANEELDARGRG
jgi:transcriptional regulator GlxA family with amidase domain